MSHVKLWFVWVWVAQSLHHAGLLKPHGNDGPHDLLSFVVMSCQLSVGYQQVMYCISIIILQWWKVLWPTCPPFVLVRLKLLPLYIMCQASKLFTAQYLILLLYSNTLHHRPVRCSQRQRDVQVTNRFYLSIFAGWCDLKLINKFTSVAIWYNDRKAELKLDGQNDVNSVKES